MSQVNDNPYILHHFLLFQRIISQLEERYIDTADRIVFFLSDIEVTIEYSSSTIDKLQDWIADNEDDTFELLNYFTRLRNDLDSSNNISPIHNQGEGPATFGELLTELISKTSELSANATSNKLVLTSRIGSDNNVDLVNILDTYQNLIINLQDELQQISRYISDQQGRYLTT